MRALELTFVPRRFIHLAWQAMKVTVPAIDKVDEFVANVFALVEIFKQEQSDTEVSIAQLDTGSQPPKRAKTRTRKLENLKVNLARTRLL